MKKFLVVAAAFVLLCGASISFAVTDEEIFRAFSLNLSTPGARAVAMGGAFIGLADDATAAETNPAGLSILAKPEVSVQYRYANGRSLNNNIVGIPITNMDGTPSPVLPGEFTTGFAEFHSNDRQEAVNELGFISLVYPMDNFTLAVSRHELINSDAKLFGSLSASPFHFVEPNSFQGASTISDTNYNFSIAGKLNDKFSLGGSIKISDFSFRSSIGARQKSEQIYGEHFSTSIDNSSTKVGFNVGALYHVTPRISLGGVYKFEPKFTLDTNVLNADPHSGPVDINKEVDFDVPDTVGFGISVVPVKNVHVNLDIVRVFYSQLEPVDTGFSLFTHLLPTVDPLHPNAGAPNIINFAVDDSTDIHLGGEYLVTSGKTTFGFRAGYAREGRNRFYLASAANPYVQAFLEPIFGLNPGNDVTHWTAGVGVTQGPIQLDLAVDMTEQDAIDVNLNNILNKQVIADAGVDYIFSAVYRF